MARTLKVAVLLAGCGHLDGSEVREAVLTLLALDQHGAAFQCIAPHADQHHVINHVTGPAGAWGRAQHPEEASRIARVGQCLDLAQARVEDYDALLMPGATAWPRTSALRVPGAGRRGPGRCGRLPARFFAAKKPVGAICIAPALVALALSGQSAARLTLGGDPGCADAMRDGVAARIHFENRP
ncbi:MAG: isoprenoid biosynthesis protein ElbB [Holophagaceae bacterium]|nr:isoprenoid biosynthesis protein ElbB [Holophagaceae bacterium]